MKSVSAIAAHDLWRQKSLLRRLAHTGKFELCRGEFVWSVCGAEEERLWRTMNRDTQEKGEPGEPTSPIN